MDTTKMQERTTVNERPALSVAFVLLPEFTLLAFTCFLEALRHAADEADRSRQVHCRWTVIGADLEPVRSSAGVDVAPWEKFGDPSRFDYIVVVGGLLRAHSRIEPAIYRFLGTAASQRVRLVGLCTGSFALARAGLMKGHVCCVSWVHMREFATEFPEIVALPDQLFVVDGDRITCAGGAGAVDLAVHLIERHCGQTRALKSLRQMLIDTVRNQRAPQPVIGSDGMPATASPLVRRAILWMEEYLDAELDLGDLAQRLCVSSSRLRHAFQDDLGLSPAQFARGLRLRRARWLVLNTDNSIAEIAVECGFADASHLGRWYRREFNASPARERWASTTRAAGGATLPL
jgi:transcriptional regulator GlxA family with amidase domain